MKKQKKQIRESDYPIYELSNPHFQNTAIITRENQNLKGQFVNFNVAENGTGYKKYPSEKFCFLPLENEKEFRDAYKANNGVFSERPWYIKELGLDEIKKIIIKPVMLL